MFGCVVPELFKKQSNFNKHLKGFVPHCIFPKTKPCDETLQRCFMTTKQQDTQGSWKRTMPSGNITGGWAYILLSKTTCRDVAHVNSLRLTDILQSQHFYLWKGQNRQGPLPIAPWTSSRTFHYQKDSTLSWS